MTDSIISTLKKRKKKHLDGKVVYLTSLIIDFNKADDKPVLGKLKHQKGGSFSKSVDYLKSVTAHDVFTIILILITLVLLFML